MLRNVAIQERVVKWQKRNPEAAAVLTDWPNRAQVAAAAATTPQLMATSLTMAGVKVRMAADNGGGGGLVRGKCGCARHVKTVVEKQLATTSSQKYNSEKVHSGGGGGRRSRKTSVSVTNERSSAPTPADAFLSGISRERVKQGHPAAVSFQEDVFP
jgi:hypothetical protein